MLDFKERGGNGRKDYVACEIVCERDAHKGILLGHKGSAMKAMASAARVDIEEFLSRSVYLEMSLRVDKDWRSNAGTLRSYGY